MISEGNNGRSMKSEGTLNYIDELQQSIQDNLNQTPLSSEAASLRVEGFERSSHGNCCSRKDQKWKQSVEDQ